MKTILLIIGLCFVAGINYSVPLTESTFTEIIKEVNTLNAAGEPVAAKLNDLFTSSQRVRTGPASRAELTAPDKTITRVGANSVFSFADSGRTVNLEKGNILFHSPKGLGGGTIRSGGAAAAVLGTTLIVSATDKGGFKVILLEGSGTVTLPNGKSVTLKAGQEVFVLPGAGGFSKVIDINLAQLVQGSQLVQGFSSVLSSMGEINLAIQQQQKDINSGGLKKTGLTADQFVVLVFPGNGLTVQDFGSYQTAVPHPISQDELNYINFLAGLPQAFIDLQNPNIGFLPDYPTQMLTKVLGAGRTTVVVSGPVY